MSGVGCRQHGPQGPEGDPLSLAPSFATGSAGKATDIGFETGDQVGLYVTHENRMLETEGNLIENALMEAAQSSGTTTLEGNPTIFYPSTKEGVRLYAYYPYQSTINSPRALAASVAADQQLRTAYMASDWCWGTLATTPSTAATPIQFHHQTAQINLTAALPSSGKIGDKTISKVSASALHGVWRSGSWDLSNGGWSDLQQTSSVTPYRPDAAAARFLTLLPPQTIEAGKVFASITVQYTDGTDETFDYTPTDPVELQIGRSTTIALQLNDRGTVTLAAVQVDDWVDTATDGSIVDPVNNQFTAHWRLPHRYFDRVSRVELVLDLPGGGTKTVETKEVQVVAGNNKTASSYTFNMALDPSSGIAYTYRIAAIRFYDGTELLQECASVVGTHVYRSGKYTIGVEQDRLLAVRSGTISDWNELLYGDRLKGVDNDFEVQLIEYPSFASVGAVRLTIDGQPYTFNNVTAVSGSHAMLSQTTVFRFPDANGKAPYKYPFVVEGVALLDESGTALGDGTYGCAIRVSRAGQISMQLYRGVLSALSTTVTGFNSSSTVGQPEYGGAVTSNPIRVVYCDGRQQAMCSSVGRVDVTIGGREVALSGYAMDGTRFAAQSRTPHVDIVAGGVDRPVSYPYAITAIKLKRADGSLLAAASFTDPLVVNWWGEVTIELMGGMEDVAHVEHRPTSADYVEIGGLRWAKGNLVAVDSRNCRVGAAADGGVYFQFGSLIGWKGGALANGGTGQGIPDGAMLTNGSYWNGAAAWSWANDAMVWPSELVGTPTTWPQNATTNQWYFGLQTGWSAAGQNIRDYPGLASGALADKGIGDPCTYYLGDPWRLPTSPEIVALCNNQGGSGWLAWTTVGGSWTTSPTYGGNFSSSRLFFPASGSRNYSNGSFTNVTTYGYCWSSSVNSATFGYYLRFNQPNGVIPQYNDYRSNGFPVRCVSDAPKRVHPPTASDYVEIDMGSGKKLKWAKGNLVATDGHGCAVGAPNDGGLYFQFGSLIGWKGGNAANNGTGKGIPDVAWNTKWWNGAAAWSWNNDVAVTPVELASKPTAWPNNNAANIETHNDFYFNYSKAPYETQFQNIRDYPGLASGALANKGIGDACSYYLGGSWRLPTAAEFNILCNNPTSSGQVPWADVGGSWSTYNGVLGGYFSNNRLFFPQSGYRVASSGDLNESCDSGRSRTSTIVSELSSFTLYFDCQRVGVPPQQVDSRSIGFPIRCVSE